MQHNWHSINNTVNWPCVHLKPRVGRQPRYVGSRGWCSLGWWREGVRLETYGQLLPIIIEEGQFLGNFTFNMPGGNDKNTRMGFKTRSSLVSSLSLL